MDYKEYKKASERHLDTCFQLYLKAKDIEEKRINRGINRNEARVFDNILANLYYLSGYMLECLYTYAMCKYEGISTVTKVVLDDPYSVAIPTPYRVCYNHSRKNSVSSSPLRYSITRPSHKMTAADLSFFNGIVTIPITIPLLDGSTNLTGNAQYLLDAWSAYERYTINYSSSSTFPPFIYNNVTLFFWEIVNVCALMSEHIIREITRHRKLIKKRP